MSSRVIPSLAKVRIEFFGPLHFYVLTCFVCFCLQIYNKVDVYPLVACVAVAVSFAVYKGSEHLLVSLELLRCPPKVPSSPPHVLLQANPDVSLNPSRRGETLKHTEEEGHAWKERVQRHYMHKDDSLHNLSMLNAFSPAYWERRMQVQRDPAHFTREGAGKAME